MQFIPYEIIVSQRQHLEIYMLGILHFQYELKTAFLLAVFYLATK